MSASFALISPCGTALKSLHLLPFRSAISEWKSAFRHFPDSEPCHPSTHPPENPLNLREKLKKCIQALPQLPLYLLVRALQHVHRHARGIAVLQLYRSIPNRSHFIRRKQSESINKRKICHAFIVTACMPHRLQSSLCIAPAGSCIHKLCHRSKQITASNR